MTLIMFSLICGLLSAILVTTLNTVFELIKINTKLDKK